MTGQYRVDAVGRPAPKMASLTGLEYRLLELQFELAEATGNHARKERALDEFVQRSGGRRAL